MKSFVRVLTLSSTALIASLSISAHAVPILWASDSAGNLGTVDVATGAVNLIGNMGKTMTDIAFDPNGNLYGIDFNTLFSIDKNTAAATQIGSIGTGLNSLVFSSNGTLYAANSSLYTINTATGAASLVGGSNNYSSSGDLAFVGASLFLSSGYSTSDSLMQLDTATGAGTFIGTLGYSGVYGLATSNTNLFGVTGTSIIGVNTLTGAGTLLSNYGGQGLFDAWGSAFYEEACSSNCTPTSVPEPSGLALLATGFLGLLGLGLRRRKTQA